MDDEARPGSAGSRKTARDGARTSEPARYVLAVLGFIVLGWFTKHFLSLTYGLLYFVLVLDVLPRLARWIRRLVVPARDEEAA